MPPVYEALLLNTVVPQIQAAQAGDSYVMVVNATTDALRITQTGTGNALVVEDSSNPDSSPFVVTAAGDVGIGTSSPTQKLTVNGVVASIGQATALTASSAFFDYNTTSNLGRFAAVGNTTGTAAPIYFSQYSSNASVGRDAMIIDSSGNLGLGVTPSAWRSNTPAFQIGSAGVCLFADSGIAGELGNNVFLNSSSQYIYLRADPASRYKQYQGIHSWLVSTNTPVIGNPITFSTAMTLDASGNLALGNTSVTSGMRLDVQGGDFRVGDDANQGFEAGYSAGASQAFIQGYNRGTSAFIDLALTGSNIKFLSGSSATECARLTSGGYFKASNSGTYNNSTSSYHELYSNASGDWIGYFTQATASNPNGVVIQYTAAAPNGTGNTFLYCNDNAAVRATIRSNGGFANYQANDVNLSDARLKTDIVPVASYWDKIKSLEIVSFKYKDQTDDIPNVGVIAQQVESVAPEFVSNDGFGKQPEGEAPYKTIYTTDMYHAAIKALQEAMARIETLEAEVAALKGA